jgi:hypothetical protein
LADDGKVEFAVTGHRLKGWEDFLVGEIAGGAEEHKRVRSRLVVSLHGAILSETASTLRHRPILREEA